MEFEDDQRDNAPEMDLMKWTWRIEEVQELQSGLWLATHNLREALNVSNAIVQPPNEGHRRFESNASEFDVWVRDSNSESLKDSPSRW